MRESSGSPISTQPCGIKKWRHRWLYQHRLPPDSNPCRRIPADEMDKTSIVYTPISLPLTPHFLANIAVSLHKIFIRETDVCGWQLQWGSHLHLAMLTSKRHLPLPTTGVSLYFDILFAPNIYILKVSYIVCTKYMYIYTISHHINKILKEYFK